MDIRELEDFKLSDAVKFHNELNPNLWENNKLKLEVKQQLLKIANDFILELGVAIPKIQDITISGSNAAYSYTPFSDLDLHILVDFNQLPDDEIYQELFTAKKSLYNDEHDISVYGVPVELYVQDSNQPHVSLGEYSIVNDDWIRIPKKQKANFDQNETKAKYEKLGSMIELALKSNSLEKVEKVLDVLKRYRKAGLQSKGEFGPENLSYKALRKLGYIQKLYDYKNELHSQKLSIEEVLDTGSNQTLKFKNPPYYNQSGIKQYFFTTKNGQKYVLNLSHAYASQWYTDIMKMLPQIDDYYKGMKNQIRSQGVYAEFEKRVKSGKGDYGANYTMQISGTGDQFEVMGNVYNAMIQFINTYHPFYLFFSAKEESRQSLYTLLVKKAIRSLPNYKYIIREDFSGEKFYIVYAKNVFTGKKKAQEDYDPNGPPPGPEFKPTMPKGTIKVDVSDVYDWYKLGQHISNMKGLGKHDFGQGPPSTILSFGDEDLEHKYIDALNKTGLDTTDIDPKAHDTMKGQKVDPTYNVNEAFDKPYPLTWETGDHGDVDALAQLEDGTYLHIMFNESYWSGGKPGDKMVDVQFYRDNSQDITGKGDSQRVFATVLHAIKEFIKKYDPPYMYFSSVKEDDPKGNRTKLYQKLVDKFAASMGYNVSVDDHQRQIGFTLSKKNKLQESRKIIEGTNCKNCVWWKKDSEKPVGKDELNSNGGLKPPNKEYIAMSKRVDLVTLPGKDTVKVKGFCYHKDINDWVTERMCCAKWDAKGVIRDYKGESPLMEENLDEASGYIPSEKEKNDPRFKTALTIDVKPDSIKKNASAFRFKTSRAGIPPQAKTNGKL